MFVSAPPRRPVSRFVPLLALVALVACDANEAGDQERLVALRVADLSHDADALVGRWDLVSTTSSGFGGPPTTTPYRGIRSGYTFRADGMVEYRATDGTIRSEPYAVVPAGPSTPDAPPSLKIGDTNQSWGIDGDRLYFDSRSFDGNLLEFLRR